MFKKPVKIEVVTTACGSTLTHCLFFMAGELRMVFTFLNG